MSKIPGSELAAIVSGARRKVEVLSRSFPSRSGLFPERLSQAADYIELELVSLGYEKIRRQHFEVRGKRYSNLVVELEGKNPTRAGIIIGAHYDTVVGTPGADDNASGVAGLLELARLLRNYSNTRPIQLVAYANEEPPYFHTAHMGSRQHAKSLKDAGRKVLVMMALEMLGYGGEHMKQVYPFPVMRRLGGYPKHGDFISIVGNLRSRKMLHVVREAMRQGCGVSVESLAAPGFLPPLFLSDHSSYWKYNFPALMITDTAFLRNPHYHQPTDTAETLNYDFLAEVVNGVYAAVITLDALE